MDYLFTNLLLKIIPFYFFILIGFISGRYFNVDRQSIVSILFYFIVPVVFFEFGMKLNLTPELCTLPIFILFSAISLNKAYLALGHMLWKGTAKPNVIAFAAGTANTGYFGLPVAIILFDEATVAIYMLINIVLSFYDYTLGAFTIARSQFSKKQAIISVAKLPILYAFALGVIVGELGFKESEFLKAPFDYVRGCYATLGLMIVGLGLSSIQKFVFDLKFCATLLSARFIAAPLIASLLIQADRHFLKLYSEQEQMAFLLTSILPPAANTVVFAALHHAHPEEAAMAVLIGTLLGLFYLPLMVGLLF